MAIADWSTNPANNTLVGSINWTEGQLPSTVNGSARQMMADVAAWRNDLATAASTYALTAGTTFTGQVGRDAQFYMNLVASKPRLNFDTNDFIEYDRTGNRFDITANGGTLSIYTNNLTYKGNKIFHEGNMGPGSGLNADTVDGKHADQIQASGTMAAKGHLDIPLASGQTFRRCWGNKVVGANQQTTDTFSASISNVFGVSMGGGIAGATNVDANIAVFPNTSSSVSLINSADGSSQTIYWEAWGIA